MGTGTPKVPGACPGGSGRGRTSARGGVEVWSCLWEVRPWKDGRKEAVCTTKAGFVRVFRETETLGTYCCCLVAKSCPTVLRLHDLWPIRLLCPWDFPGKNTGVGCHSLLQGIFATQGSELSLPHLQANSLPLSHEGGPLETYVYIYFLYIYIFFFSCMYNQEPAHRIIEAEQSPLPLLVSFRPWSPVPCTCPNPGLSTCGAPDP